MCDKGTRCCELLISSCEAFSDLWEYHIQLLDENWGDRNIPTTIVTDKVHYDDSNLSIRVFSAGEGKEMPQRIGKVLETINSEYVLLTFDDYFLIDKIDNQKIDYLLEVMEKEKLDYMRMFPIPKEKKKIKGYKDLYWIDLSRNYSINLYPGLWRTEFLRQTVSEKMNVWDYEVSLTRIARDNNKLCAMSRGDYFPFLDVIRKGKILHKAKKYLDKRGMVLNRELISWKEELRLELMKNSKKVLPRFVQKYVKIIMEKFGMKFISKGI